MHVERLFIYEKEMFRKILVYLIPPSNLSIAKTREDACKAGIQKSTA